MNRFWELILGLDPGFLNKDGEFFLAFNPKWPWHESIGAGVWNFLLVVLAVLLVVYVYRREGRSRPVRIVLGTMRLLLLGLLVALLNRPVLTLSQSRTEPSVLAVMIDDSISMCVKDAAPVDASPKSRLEAAVGLLTDQDQAMLRELEKQHVIRLFPFNRDKQPATTMEELSKLEPTGQTTQIVSSIRSVMQELQGQRVAGIVVLTDGRETPAQPMAEAIQSLKDFGMKIYPVAIGSDRAPMNIDIPSINVQESVFKGDIVNVRAMVRGSGLDAGHVARIVVKDKNTGAILTPPSGGASEKDIALDGSQPVEVELQFLPAEVGPLDIVVEAVAQPGELDDEDNVRTAQLAVLDAKIALLYVDGYPRWEYRYIKNEMIRDRTVDISCLLTSADPTFAQEGDKPIKRFPESIEEMLEYDVVLFGDVDPRQFTDSQLQLVNEFVSRKGGGFGMIAGPRWSPQSFRNTAIEPILPVIISQVTTEDSSGSITQGFRPTLTKVGSQSSIFRFFADRDANDQFLAEGIQPIFWYCRGVTSKSGVGEVYAEHPADTGMDGRKAPILVLGRYGAGRTLFSAIDDSWRWRFYTGETIFDTYWVQQIRYLARSKKLGQRRLTLASLRPVYELGEQVRVSMRVLDAQLLQQLPDQIRVELVDELGQVIRQENLIRQEGQIDLYVATFAADRIGRFTVQLPPIAGGVDGLSVPIEVSVPRMELVQPQVDRMLLSRLASETLGETIDFDRARSTLPALIPSAAKIIPVETSQPLWDTPLVMMLFVGLITLEWVLRKMFGML
jgi:uncharacterized membrane protein